jgi:hypothetical protein
VPPFEECVDSQFLGPSVVPDDAGNDAGDAAVVLPERLIDSLDGSADRRRPEWPRPARPHFINAWTRSFVTAERRIPNETNLANRAAPFFATLLRACRTACDGPQKERWRRTRRFCGGHWRSSPQST